MDDPEITTLLRRLSRPQPSGGFVIERAAIAASGPSSSELIEWILAHGGSAEAPPASPSASGGLHGARISTGRNPTPPRAVRFVIPADAFSA